jgi:RNA polymerase sigma-70 factor (ECF subfamily)
VDAHIDELTVRSWERECVARAVRGDRDAFGELYDAHAERIFQRVLFPVLGNASAAEDALAETFRAAFQRLDRYQPGEAGIYPWLATIARNKAMDLHRARKVTGRALANFEALLAPLQVAPGSPEQLLDEASSQQRLVHGVHETLAQINARYREAIALRFLEDQPREACAEHLGVKVATFDVLLLRALRAFRKRWEELQSPARAADLEVR